MAKTWPEVLTDPEMIGEALDWVRWKTRGRALFAIIVGPNGIVGAMDRELDPEDAIAILQAESDAIAKMLRTMREARKTHGYTRRG